MPSWLRVALLGDFNWLPLRVFSPNVRTPHHQHQKVGIQDLQRVCKSSLVEDRPKGLLLKVPQALTFPSLTIGPNPLVVEAIHVVLGISVNNILL
jgi:hypothetical protein